MKRIYKFEEGNIGMKDLLGGKGASLSEMSTLGLKVPPGFTITTQNCLTYLEKGKLDDELKNLIIEHIQIVEEKMDKAFFDHSGKKIPLLLSVRSGAKVSMPGMMDTILNLGLNDESVEIIAEATGNKIFAYDSYRRFIEMFCNVVYEIPGFLFEKVIEEQKKLSNVEKDQDLTEEDLKNIIIKFKEVCKKETKKVFPTKPIEQLYEAIEAVFRSWNNPRAFTYRNLNSIPHDLGTAVNVQSMVFGNMGNDSGTGVVFSRNPSTGENEVFGEFLTNAQGEDIVAGKRTPLNIETFSEHFPMIHQEFLSSIKKLEDHFKDMQDMEFTIEKNVLYFLQTRNGKRTANAAINIVCDLVKEKKIDKKEAINRIESNDIENLLHPVFDQEVLKQIRPLSKALPASPGAAYGKVCFTSAQVKELVNQGETVILVREETSPDDIEGMIYADGILTAKGGMTSHAAVVARGIGKCCISGCEELFVNYEAQELTLNNKLIKFGDVLSLDGYTGFIYDVHIPKIKSKLNDNFAEFLSWLDEYKKISVRLNADSPGDILSAADFNADGIGLCRTEHMFFKKDRINNVRGMILSSTLNERQEYLNNIFEYQKNDFTEIFSLMDNKAVNIRLLDPPLHEFLPKTSTEFQEIAQIMNMTKERVKLRTSLLSESNPMLGHRGCRLAITYPEIYVMQVKAIMEAAVEVTNAGKHVLPEIMIPLVSDKKELVFIKKHLIEIAETVLLKHNKKIKYSIGTMIEVPRAALLSDQIAEEADFFSYGTNDLTQMTFGFSRDDSNKFINEYLQSGILTKDPFVELDQDGVGKLIEMSSQLGRKVKPNLKLGICGEQAADSKALPFYKKLGINYLSCSPFRVPGLKLQLAKLELSEND